MRRSYRTWACLFGIVLVTRRVRSAPLGTPRRFWIQQELNHHNTNDYS